MRKRLPLLLLPIFVLSACGSATDKLLPRVEPRAVTSAGGKLGSNSNNGSHTIQLFGSDSQFLGDKINIRPDGSFNVALPTSVPENRLTSVEESLKGLKFSGAECRVLTPITNSNPTVKGIGVFGAQTNTNAQYFAATVTHGFIDRDLKIHGVVYSTGTAHLTGKLDCAPLTAGAMASLPIDVDVKVVPGWNPVVVDVHAGVNLLAFAVEGAGQLINTTEYMGGWMTPDNIQTQLKP